MLPTSKLGPFTLGIDNRARDYALRDPKSGATAVRDAVNADVSDTGNFTRRTGSTLTFAGERTHSLWSNNKDAFFINDGSLKRFTAPDGAVTLLDGLSPIARGTYVDVPGRGVAFSNGQVIKRITADGVRPFGLGQPQAPAELLPTVGGSLKAGQYEVAVTYVDAYGEESGGVVSEYVEVPDNGAIIVLLYPPLDSEAISTRIYVSARNSGMDYLVAEVPAASTSHEIVLVNNGAQRLATKYMLPLPPGDILAFHNGRTYSHANGVVSFTQPWSGQHNPFSDYFAFPKPLSIMAAIAGGIYFVADKTYFLPGEATIEGNLRVIVDTPGVFGTLVRIPDEDALLWFTPHGIAKATTGGTVTFLQEDRVDVARASTGAAFYRERDGVHQVVTSLREPRPNHAGASSWFTVKMGSRETRNDF